MLRTIEIKLEGCKTLFEILPLKDQKTNAGVLAIAIVNSEASQRVVLQLNGPRVNFIRALTTFETVNNKGTSRPRTDLDVLSIRQATQISGAIESISGATIVWPDLSHFSG